MLVLQSFRKHFIAFFYLGYENVDAFFTVFMLDQHSRLYGTRETSGSERKSLCSCMFFGDVHCIYKRGQKDPLFSPL